MTHNNNEWMYLNEICIFTVGYIFTQNKILPWNVHTFNDNEDKLSFRQNINNFHERMTVAWISKEIGESHFMFFFGCLERILSEIFSGTPLVTVKGVRMSIIFEECDKKM